MTGTATKLKDHPTGSAEAAKAQQAALPPAEDKMGQAKASRIDTMAAAKPKPFDKAAFIAALEKAINDAAPKNVEEAQAFASSGKAEAIRSQVAAKVTQGKEGAGQDVADKTQQPPDLSTAKDKRVVPLKDDPLTKPGDPRAGRAMPGPAPPEQKDFRAGPCELAAQMREAEITDQVLERSNEPQMLHSLEAKRDAEAHSLQAPGLVQANEGTLLTAAQTGADQDSASAVTEMFDAKKDAFGEARTEKGEAKAKDEAERTRITAEINKIFDATKTEVGQILAGLDAKVTSTFDAGEARAKQTFTSRHQADMKAYLDERHSADLEGLLNWGSDWLFGLPPEVNQIYVKAKGLYVADMRKVISDVADLVGAELTRATQRIATGRQQVKDYVAKQPVALREIAQEAATEMDAEFDQLGSDVDAKQEALIQDLAQKYIEARDAVDAEIQAEQEKNKGLIEDAKAFISDSIDAITELKNLFMGALSRAAAAWTAVLADPVGFMGSFVGAVKNGFQSFSKNILKHLKKGLMDWLFGALSSAGIQVPETLDTKGILRLVLSTLGATWDNLKARIAQKAPALAGALEFLEDKIEVFKVLATTGISGLMDLILAKVGDLKETVVGPLRTYVVEKIVKAGISWLVGMLNPAGALIKIVQAVVAIVQWFRERAAQLADLMNAVADAVLAIARGGAGGVPAMIEQALAKAVPVVISFLASLLGLGGISKKVRDTVEAAQKPVNKAIDAAIDPAVKLGKKLVDKIKNAAKQGLEKIKDILKPKTESFSMSGSGHQLVLKTDPMTMHSAGSTNPREDPDGLAAAVRALFAETPDEAKGNEEAKVLQEGAAKSRSVWELQLEVTRKSQELQEKLAKVATSLKKGYKENLTEEEIAALKKTERKLKDDLYLAGKHFQAYADRFKRKDISHTFVKTQEELWERYGMNAVKIGEAQGVCGNFNVQITVRSMNPLSPEREKDKDKYLPKPEKIKAKSINERDVILGKDAGIQARDVGVIGFFIPKMPEAPGSKDEAAGVEPLARETAGSQEAAGSQPGARSQEDGTPMRKGESRGGVLSVEGDESQASSSSSGTAPGKPSDFTKLAQRFRDRSNEYAEDRDAMQYLIDEKYIEINEGKIKHVESGKEFAGDHDLYAIKDASGAELWEARGKKTKTPASLRYWGNYKKQVVAALNKTTFAAQHGALMDWKPRSNRHKEIFEQIKDNPEALLLITEHSYSETQP